MEWMESPMRKTTISRTTMKYTSKEESILHYLRKIVLHGKGKVTIRAQLYFNEQEGKEADSKTKTSTLRNHMLSVK